MDADEERERSTSSGSSDVEEGRCGDAVVACVATEEAVDLLKGVSSVARLSISATLIPGARHTPQENRVTHF